jgi:hypothetical protein
MFKELLLAFHRRDPDGTLKALHELMSDPEHPERPPQSRARRLDRHRQWVASLGFSAVSGVRLSRRPKMVPLRMPLGLSLEYLFKDWGVHLMLFPMDFDPDVTPPAKGAQPRGSAAMPGSPSALALGVQLGVLKRSGDALRTFGLDVRFCPAPREAATRPHRFWWPPGTWRLSGFAGTHFPLVDFN